VFHGRRAAFHEKRIAATGALGDERAAHRAKKKKNIERGLKVPTLTTFHPP
jgi:hypothetical protein